MPLSSTRALIGPEHICLGLFASAGLAAAAAFTSPPATVNTMTVPVNTAPAGGAPSPDQRAAQSLPWRLNNPEPNVVPEERSNPAAVIDKLASRVRSMEQRAQWRAYEGAPPVIPHPIAGLNIQTCRACHASGITAGDKVARMVSHTYLMNCTQCHVEASPGMGDDHLAAGNTFAGLRPSGYGGTRAWAGAPPVVPHTTFMRTNCISCHGEHGYDGWRPDHLARTNCVQCHVPAAEHDQLAPSFGIPSVPDGHAAPPRH